VYPDEEIDLIAEFSSKIPAKQRRNTAVKISRALQTVFIQDKRSDSLWKKFTSKVPWEHERYELVAKAASDLEFYAQMMSRTADGYSLRVDSQVAAVRLMHDEDSWLEGDIGMKEGFEDVKEVISICKKVMSKR